jgi:hypothetical protein
VSSVEARQRAAHTYLRRGIAVIPVPDGEKNPGYDAWQDLGLTLFIPLGPVGS